MPWVKNRPQKQAPAEAGGKSLFLPRGRSMQRGCPHALYYALAAPCVQSFFSLCGFFFRLLRRSRFSRSPRQVLGWCQILRSLLWKSSFLRVRCGSSFFRRSFLFFSVIGPNSRRQRAYAYAAQHPGPGPLKQIHRQKDIRQPPGPQKEKEGAEPIKNRIFSSKSKYHQEPTDKPKPHIHICIHLHFPVSPPCSKTLGLPASSSSHTPRRLLLSGEFTSIGRSFMNFSIRHETEACQLSPSSSCRYNTKDRRKAGGAFLRSAKEALKPGLLLPTANIQILKFPFVFIHTYAIRILQAALFPEPENLLSSCPQRESPKVPCGEETKPAFFWETGETRRLFLLRRSRRTFSR